MPSIFRTSWEISWPDISKPIYQKNKWKPIKMKQLVQGDLVSFWQRTYPRSGPWFPTMGLYHGPLVPSRWPHGNPWHKATCTLCLSVPIWSNLLGQDTGERWGEFHLPLPCTEGSPRRGHALGDTRLQAKEVNSTNIYLLGPHYIPGTGRPWEAPQPT